MRQLKRVLAAIVSRLTYEDDPEYLAAVDWYNQLPSLRDDTPGEVCGRSAQNHDLGAQPASPECTEDKKTELTEQQVALIDLLYDYAVSELQQTSRVYDQLASKLEGLLKFSLLLFGALVTVLKTFPQLESAAFPWFYVSLLLIASACFLQAIGLITQTTPAPIDPKDLIDYARQMDQPAAVKHRMAASIACTIVGFRSSIHARSNMHDWSIGLIIVSIFSALLMFMPMPL